ncbi:hypothetical protein ZOSMA_1679G00010, partial [Zostera marina]
SIVNFLIKLDCYRKFFKIKLIYDKCVTGNGAVLIQDRHPMAYYSENQIHRQSESVDKLRTLTICSDLRMLKM